MYVYMYIHTDHADRIVVAYMHDCDRQKNYIIMHSADSALYIEHAHTHTHIHIHMHAHKGNNNSSDKVRVCGVLIESGFLVRITLWREACSKLVQALGAGRLLDRSLEFRECLSVCLCHCVCICLPSYVSVYVCMYVFFHWVFSQGEKEPYVYVWFVEKKDMAIVWVCAIEKDRQKDRQSVKISRVYS
jgi:hypothetical protein